MFACVLVCLIALLFVGVCDCLVDRACVCDGVFCCILCCVNVPLLLCLCVLVCSCVCSRAGLFV